MKEVVLIDVFHEKSKNRHFWRNFQKNQIFGQNQKKKNFLMFGNTLFAAKYYEFHMTKTPKNAFFRYLPYKSVVFWRFLLGQVPEGQIENGSSSNLN